MDFDFKVTTWERVTVAPEDEKELLKLIKKGLINSASDVFSQFNEANCEKLDDTSEQMTTEENGESSTIEIINDNGEHIYWNGNETK